nr:uncharacterized protein LOC109756748 isoform X2 [Aegilops tauschii subsp. strangulata]XP_040259375.1 uncharacterized protein LOC109756748 isoform X2 [Aegilops tauschii subsp. strangulata]
MPGEEGQHHLGDVDGSRRLWRCSSWSRSLAGGSRKPPALRSRAQSPTSSCPQDPVAWKTLGAKLGKVQRDQERLLDRYDTLDALARQLRLKIAARRGQGGRSAAARHVTSTGISDSLDSDSESGMFLLGRAC